MDVGSHIIHNLIVTTLVFLSIRISTSKQTLGKQQPHIVLIVADDLGWNDVGFHGSNQIPTPNIDALAYNGVILNRHYVQPTCTPSRAALLTGRYPIRYGLQGTPIIAGQASALPLTEKILPQYLKDLGYSTHLVGKWHLGSHKKHFTPTQRGFDSHFGYWNGFISYRNSTHVSRTITGKDARRGLEQAGGEMVDRYATDVFTEEARKVIESCKHQKNPLFLMVSHLAVHSGNPGPNLLEVSNKSLNDERFSYIEDKSRRLYAGMVTSLDESVGSIIESLDNNEMLKSSIVLFMSDNGAPTTDLLWGHGNTGSNWPLRGEKGSVLDGGVRGVAAMWSPWLKNKHRVFEHLFHITDWLPTLYTAAGGNVHDLGTIDGFNQWSNFIDDSTRPIRTIILVNIDEIRGEEALILNEWKIVKSNRASNTSCFLKYGGEPERVAPPQDRYDVRAVADSLAGARLLPRGSPAAASLHQLFLDVRALASVDGPRSCAGRVASAEPDRPYECFDGHCLFDVRADPCEYRNAASRRPDVVGAAVDLLRRYRDETVPQHRPDVDPASDPGRHGGYWDTWDDRSGLAGTGRTAEGGTRSRGERQ